MIDAASVANLVSYSAQIACIVAAGALLPALLRLDAPRVRYHYWRALVLLCLGLPSLQRWILQPAGLTTDAIAVRLGESSAVSGAGTASPFASLLAISWWEVAGAVVLMGMAARVLWIGAGLLKLRGLRHAGEAAGESAVANDLQRILGTHATIRYVNDLPQPVTFGVLVPVVLLPSSLQRRPEDVRRAVLAHELLHVQRRDWAWVLAEEAVRAAFWFHPAIWWLISRVQLAREEVVDELAVLLTGQRRTYVEALLAFADEPPLAPVPAFARRRHLFRRVMLISREAVMSPKQIVASCAVMALVVASGGWYAARAFPLANARAPLAQDTYRQTPGPLEQKTVPVTPENPIPRRVNVTPAEYPAEAAAQKASGSVTLMVTLDELGRVAETRMAGVYVRMASGEVRLTNSSSAGLEQLLARADDPKTAELRRVIDAFIGAAVSAVEQWRYDPPYQAPISFPITVSFGENARTDAGIPPPPPPAPPAPRSHVSLFSPAPGEQSTGWTADGALRVGESVKTPTKIRDVKPVYPPSALASRVQGVVILEARIEPDGTVGGVRVLRSIPLLDQAAIDAVKQWRFTPTLLNGQAVPVVMTLTLAFTLPEAETR